MSGVSGVGIFWALTSFFASLGACIGFYMPYWISGSMVYGNDVTPVHFGIFRRCNYPALDKAGTIQMVMECGRYTTFGDIPSMSWQIATLTVGVGCCIAVLVGLTALAGTCVGGVIIPTVARTAGILQMCSGLLMGAGIGVYPNGWDSPEVRQSCGYTSKSYNIGECSLSWSFFLTAGGAGLTLACSILSFHAPKPKRAVSSYRL